jgi:NAD(P)-dependent dehydrogenase (short-subunit alcohol dehydrogenase family)
MSHSRILITGANKGIGLATVKAVLEADSNTAVLLGSRDLQRGEAARAGLVAERPEWADRIMVVEIDVSSDESVTVAAQHLASRFDEVTPLHGIINNAGMGFTEAPMRTVLEVNSYGPRRVVDAFLPLLDREAGRIVNVSSAAGPMFVAACAPERQRELTHADVTWQEVEAVMKECLALAEEDGDFEAAGLGEKNAYGLSKACLTAYTIELARNHPDLVINACTPGFIETDLTRPYAEARGVTPGAMGMKAPADGTKAVLHLLFGEPGGSGWFFGSDAVRSPLDSYRSPGDPPYTGE